MSDRKFTLLELHLHDVAELQMGPRSIDTGTGTETGDEPESTTESRKRRRGLPIPLLAAGVGVVALAGVAWRALQSQ